MRQEIDADHRATAEEMTWQRANEMLQKAFQLNRRVQKIGHYYETNIQGLNV